MIFANLEASLFRRRQCYFCHFHYQSLTLAHDLSFFNSFTVFFLLLLLINICRHNNFDFDVKDVLALIFT